MFMRHGLLAAAAASCVTAFSPHLYPAASMSAARLHTMQVSPGAVCAVPGEPQLAPPLSTRRTVLARGVFVSAGLLTARLWPAYPSLAADSEEDEQEEEEEEEEVVKPKKGKAAKKAKQDTIRTDTFELADISKDPVLGPDGAPNPKTTNPLSNKTTKQKKLELAAKAKRGLPSTDANADDPDKPRPRNPFSFLPGQVDIPIITK